MDASREWPRILQFADGSAITEHSVEESYRKLAKKYHPDAGGSTDDMQQLNHAKQLALTWIKNERGRQEQAKRQQEILDRISREQATAQSYARQQYMNQMNQFANCAGQQYGAGLANAYRYQSTTEQPKEATPEPEPKQGRFGWLRNYLKEAW